MCVYGVVVWGGVLCILCRAQKGGALIPWREPLLAALYLWGVLWGYLWVPHNIGRPQPFMGVASAANGQYILFQVYREDGLLADVRKKKSVAP